MTKFNVKMSITGIQEAQSRNLEAIAALTPAGEFGEAIREAIVMLQRYAITITHVGKYTRSKSGKYRSAKPGEAGVGGGALRASHRMEVSGLSGRISIDPASVNPRTGGRPSIYGIYENARGGEHAFYDRTVSEYSAEVMSRVKGRVSVAVRK